MILFARHSKTLKGHNNVNGDEWYDIGGPDARATRRTASVTEEGGRRGVTVSADSVADWK